MDKNINKRKGSCKFKGEHGFWVRSTDRGSSEKYMGIKKHNTAEEVVSAIFKHYEPVYTGSTSCGLMKFTDIFGIWTYDDYMDIEIMDGMIETCESIALGLTFQYIKDDDNYKKYMYSTQLPFIDKKIEWGTSIRGAWFDTGKNYDICGVKFKGDLIDDVMKMICYIYKRDIGIYKKGIEDAD